MSRLKLSLMLLLTLSLLLSMLVGPAASQDEGEAADDVLVFTKTTGFRHASIPAGVAAVEALGAEHGFGVDHTEDAGQFTLDNLAQYATVVWLNTTGNEVLDAEQQQAFEAYIAAGGGFVGIHSASDTHYDWEWYGGLVGAYFDRHPPGMQTAEIFTYDRVHPSTAHLDETWTRHDEWYDFQTNPSGDVHVLLGLDEDSYADQVPADQGPTMGHNHPIAWCHAYEGGRSWYTGGGHSSEAFHEPDFRTHILGGIEWTAGWAEGDCGATVWDNFDKTILTREVGEPMSMAVLPDGRILHTNRQGQFRLYDPGTASTRIITTVPVYTFSEDGMQGIALSPDFEDDGWVYVYYSPVIEGFPEGAAPDGSPDMTPEDFDEWMGHNNLSRFRFVDDPGSPHLDLDSEQVILQVPINRGICCHNGGDIGFDSEGNLYLSTGDDTNPFQSNGFTPIDERPWRNPAFDGQRTSGNTADLRGKMLRIQVLDEPGDEPGLGSTYEVPGDNMFNSGEWDHLFPDGVYDAELALPEIFAMGFRNPFRFSIDPETDMIYLGDYGPDAGQPNPDRGPRATVEWIAFDEPRNHGWPYCTGDVSPEQTYVDYDFATGGSGERFDCQAGVINDSFRNTGLTQLPPATPAQVWYHNNVQHPDFPELGGGPGQQPGGRGTGPMGGPAYRYDADVAAENHGAFPEYYDGIPLLYEWVRDFIKQVHLDDDAGYLDLRGFMDGTRFWAPMDMEFGPDGSLYILEYGGGFFTEHPQASLARVSYVPEGRAPVARVSASPTSGQAPLEVSFSSEGTHHPDADEGAEIVSFSWDFGDGTTSAEENPTHTYTQNGVFNATLTVTDDRGLTGRIGVTIVVGNTRPTVDLQRPVDGGFFDWGDELGYRVRVSDPEDLRIDCDDVRLVFALGHDEHAHPMGTDRGCEGTFVTAAPGHGAAANLFWTVTARYTDRGANDLPRLTGEDQSILQPRRKQAQHFSDQSGGITTQAAADPAEGGDQRLHNVQHGRWVSYEPVNLLNIDEIQFRVRTAAGWPGGDIELRMDSPDGELLGVAEVPDTGGDYVYVNVAVEDPGVTFSLHLVFTNPDHPGTNLLNLNFFEVIGEGLAGPPPPPICEGNIILNGFDTGVADRDAGNDFCVSWVLDDGREWANRGAFQSHVAERTEELRDDGVITQQERRAIIRTAPRSGIGG